MFDELLERSEPLPLQLTDEVRRVKNVMIPVRDSINLAADLYIPANAAPDAKLPVVMEYIPYRKDEVNLRERRFYTCLPARGYILARVDVRGTGASGGVSIDEYTLQEQEDGHDVVEWLAAQPWCDGHVNMMGISYGGFTSLQVATQNPPHLTSIIPVDFTDDRYTDDCHYRGGSPRQYYDIAYYGGFMTAWNALPPHPHWAGPEWAEKWEQHLTRNEPYLLKWYKHQTDSPYWRTGSVRDVPEKIRCPVFMIGGWRDGYTNPPLRLYRALKVPCKVLIGPWNHAFPDVAIPGPRIDYLHEVARWLDYWCKGIDTGIMDEPPIVVYVQHYQEPVVDRLETKGEWRAETGWPPPGAAEAVFRLGRKGGLVHETKGGFMEAAPGDPNQYPEDPPSSASHSLLKEGVDSLRYKADVGTTGGLYSSGIQFGLPGDQRPDEAFSLVYTSEPLERSFTILGRPRAVLHFSSTAKVAAVAVSLCDAAPDGTSHLVCKGMLNATRRKSMENPEPLVPGDIYELDIQLDCTAWKFPEGHRIRLDIAGADWPNVWPTPYPATHHIHRGPAHPSRLVLPGVPSEGSARPPLFRDSPVAMQRHSDSPHPPEWLVTHDVLTGRTSMHLDLETHYRADDETVVERYASSTFQVDPRNPAQTSAKGKHVKRFTRGQQTTEARSDIAVQADTPYFHVTIVLEVKVNKRTIFTRQWIESIPRLLV